MTGILFNSPNETRHRLPQSILGNIAEDLDHGPSDDFEYDDDIASGTDAVGDTVEVSDRCICYGATILTDCCNLLLVLSCTC